MCSTLARFPLSTWSSRYSTPTAFRTHGVAVFRLSRKTLLMASSWSSWRRWSDRSSPSSLPSCARRNSSGVLPWQSAATTAAVTVARSGDPGVRAVSRCREQPQGRRFLGQISLRQPPGGEVHQQPPVRLLRPLQGRLGTVSSSAKAASASVPGGVAIVLEQLCGEAGGVGVRTVQQQGVHGRLCLIADHTDLPGGQPVVRLDQLAQVFPPQQEGPVLLRIRGGVGGGLLLVAGAEGGQDATDQGGSLAADIAVRPSISSS